MSLVFLKSKNNETSAEGNPHTPSRFSNYFTQPLHLEPNSQVALVNTQFHAKEGAELENGSQTLFTRIGNEYMNPILQYPLKDLYITNWEAYMNQIARAMNMVAIDGNFNHQLERVQTPASITHGGKTSDFNPQAVFESGFNAWFSKNDKRTYLRCVQRDVNDNVFNQGFNCLGTNPSRTYGTYGVLPAGINLGSGDSEITLIDANCARTNSTIIDATLGHAPTFFGIPSNSLQPQIAGGGIFDGAASFYNTQWACNKLSNSAIDYGRALTDFPSPFGNADGLDNSEIAFNQESGAYAALIFNGAIKQYTGQGTPGATADLNGGGHQFPSSADSGGYVVLCRDMVSKASADIYTPAAAVGATFEGRVGLTASCFGVHSMDFVNRYWGNTPFESRTNFLDNCDLMISDNRVIPRHAAARYILGVRYKWVGAAPALRLVAQAEMLDINVPATFSEYIEVGHPLDLQELAEGTNTAVQPPTTFGGGAKYDINITGGANIAKRLVWRFRWISPYQMTIEFMFEDGLATPSNYNIREDTPYLPAGTNTDPNGNWCTLYTMNLGGDNGVNGASYYFPSWHGGMCLIDYPTRNNQYSYSKGFYDLRYQYRLKEGLSAINGVTNAVDGNALPALEQQQFFSGGDPFPAGDYDIINYTMCKDQTGAVADTPLLVNTDPETFSSSGLSEKNIFWLVNSIDNLTDAQDWAAFGDGLNNAPPMFDVGEPPLLNWGTEVGLIPQGVGGILQFDEDIDNLGTPYEIYGHNPVTSLQVGNAGLTLHYQLTNLPISSQNGVVASTNKTIYVVNTRNEDKQTNNAESANVGDWYAYEPHEKLFVDLNNYSALDINRLDLLITNDNNVEAEDNLRYFTDVVLYFRQKPANQGYKQFANTIGDAPVNLDPSQPYFQNMR